ncbi:MAG TPA: hypothetical protein VMZ00_00365 [Sporichthya sp.]|nr:hypothetical protein [Sporichthya sp.]
MDITMLTDPTRCPDCAAALPTSPASCPECALPLRGPLVDRLWGLSLQTAELLRQRQSVIELLRSRTDAVPVGARNTGWGATPTTARPPAGAGSSPVTPSPVSVWPPEPREKVTPRQVQHLLLSLGVLLLAVAAVIFTVVAWGRVGIGGRTAILATLTFSAAAGTRFAHRRELPGTAEALALLTTALLLLDAYGIRENDLAGARGTATDAYWAAVLAMLALLAYAAHRVVPLRALRIVAAVGVQLPLPVLADRLGSAGATDALLAQGTVVLGVLRWVKPVSARVLLLVGGGLTYAGSAINAAVLAYGDDPTGARVSALAGACLLGLVAVSAVALARHHRRAAGLPEISSAVAAAALFGAAHAPMHRHWAHDSATAGGVALLLAAAVALTAVPRLARQWRDGPLAIVGLGGVAALLDVAEPVTRALTGPFHWLDHPWSQPLDCDARALLGTTWPHHGTVAVTLGLLTAAAVLIGVRLRASAAGAVAGAAAGALATVTAVVLPVATEAPYLVAVLGLVATGCALLVWAALSRHHVGVAVSLAGAGTVAAGIGLVWSLAARTATPLALLAVMVAAGAVRVFGARALRGLVATAAAALAGIAQAGVLTRIADQSRPVAGTVAVIAAGVLAVSAGLIPRELERRVLELTALGGAALAFLTVTEDAVWTSNALLAAGTAATLVALRRDRHRVGWLGGTLLTLSSWVRLAHAHVEQPEAYTAGPAVALLVVGWFARRRNSWLSSWQAYGAGLTTGLAPSLARTLAEDALTRPLLLGGLALLVLLAGVRYRLQAPLVLGGAVLALNALIQLVPYAAAVPRWVSIGSAGLLLLVLGTTFERRLRDLRRAAVRLGDLA